MTKPDKIDLIVQLFLAQWVFGTLGTPFPAFGKISGVPCICGKTSRSRNALKFHNYAYHKTTYYLKMENLQEF